MQCLRKLNSYAPSQLYLQWKEYTIAHWHRILHINLQWDCSWAMYLLLCELETSDDDEVEPMSLTRRSHAQRFLVGGVGHHKCIAFPRHLLTFGEARGKQTEPAFPTKSQRGRQGQESLESTHDAGDTDTNRAVHASMHVATRSSLDPNASNARAYQLIQTDRSDIYRPSLCTPSLTRFSCSRS